MRSFILLTTGPTTMCLIIFPLAIKNVVGKLSTRNDFATKGSFDVIGRGGEVAVNWVKEKAC